MKEKMKRVDTVEEDYQLLDHATENDNKKKKASTSSGGTTSMKNCQVEKCLADLSDAKAYNRRHKVCEHHSKAESVVVAGIRQRFCQQCSRFHEISEFDDAKRSCRRRLAGHNERRRKNNITDQAEGSGSEGTSHLMKEIVFDDQRGRRIQINVQERTTNYKHFHIRS